jgi:hypothetical protein
MQTKELIKTASRAFAKRCLNSIEKARTTLDRKIQEAEAVWVET